MWVHKWAHYGFRPFRNGFFWVISTTCMAWIGGKKKTHPGSHFAFRWDRKSMAGTKDKEQEGNRQMASTEEKKEQAVGWRWRGQKMQLEDRWNQPEKQLADAKRLQSGGWGFIKQAPPQARCSQWAGAAALYIGLDGLQHLVWCWGGKRWASVYAL